jgi:hypothetical protein
MKSVYFTLEIKMSSLKGSFPFLIALVSFATVVLIATPDLEPPR